MSSGESSPNRTRALTWILAPTSIWSPSSDSTWSTVTPGQADRTRRFHWASASRAAGGLVDRMGGCRCRRVEGGDVVPHHPGGEHLGAQPGDRVADHLDPALRQAAVVDVVEPGDDLVLDDVVDRLRLEVVAPLGSPVASAEGISQPNAGSNHSSHQPSRMERLAAPFSAAFMPDVPQASYGRSGLFSQHVAAGVERLGHRDVVVGQEDDPIAYLGIVGELDHLLDQRLAALVCRV